MRNSAPALSGNPELPPAVKSAIEKALRERPEILALQKNIEAARAGLQLAKMGSTPSLSFRGVITRQTNTALLPSNYYAATIELKWPLLDMGKTRQDTREARTGILRLEAALEESKQSIAMEVTRAWIHLKTSLVRFDLIQQQSRGVAATAIVAEKAYEVGRGTFFELQAANRQIKLADEGENQARYNVWEAQVEFESVQGTNIFDAHQTAARGRSK